MADRITNELQRVERVMNKLRNKIKRADLDYTVQFSINSTTPTKVVYASQMTPLANGLRPATFISHKSIDDLIDQIKAFTKEVDYDKLEVAYHEGQIVSAESTILGHKEAIEAIQNPQTENTEATAETEEQVVS